MSDTSWLRTHDKTKIEGAVLIRPEQDQPQPDKPASDQYLPLNSGVGLGSSHCENRSEKLNIRIYIDSYVQ